MLTFTLTRISHTLKSYHSFTYSLLANVAINKKQKYETRVKLLHIARKKQYN